MLYRRNYHYTFVPEEHVLSGREDLGDYRVLILPYATHFPAGLTEKILPWVSSGGTPIVAGIAGGFTNYGFPDGALMREIFGNIKYQVWYGASGNDVGGDLLWKINVGGLHPGVEDLGRGSSFAATFLSRYGRGQVLMAVRVKDWHPSSAAGQAFYQLLDAAAPRLAWADGDEMEMVLREKGDRLYMGLINPDLRKKARATVRLDRRYGPAVDRGIEGGFDVPVQQDAGGTAFDISLFPGEGTVVVLALGQ